MSATIGSAFDADLLAGVPDVLPAHAVGWRIANHSAELVSPTKATCVAMSRQRDQRGAADFLDRTQAFFRFGCGRRSATGSN